MAPFHDAQALIRDFLATSAAADNRISSAEIRYGSLRAPHQPPSLPAGSGAVYIFALGREQGESAPAASGSS
jgi:hypothetical protein